MCSYNPILQTNQVNEIKIYWDVNAHPNIKRVIKSYELINFITAFLTAQKPNKENLPIMFQSLAKLDSKTLFHIRPKIPLLIKNIYHKVHVIRYYLNDNDYLIN